MNCSNIPYPNQLYSTRAHKNITPQRNHAIITYSITNFNKDAETEYPLQHAFCTFPARRVPAEEARVLEYVTVSPTIHATATYFADALRKVNTLILEFTEHLAHQFLRALALHIGYERMLSIAVYMPVLYTGFSDFSKNNFEHIDFTPDTLTDEQMHKAMFYRYLFVEQSPIVYEIPENFAAIKEGRKTIYLRLNKCIFNYVGVGQPLKLQNTSNADDGYQVIVNKRIDARTFQDLLNSIVLEKAMPGKNEVEALVILNKRFPIEEQSKYGVVAFEII